MKAEINHLLPLLGIAHRGLRLGSDGDDTNWALESSGQFLPALLTPVRVGVAMPMREWGVAQLLSYKIMQETWPGPR